MRLFGWVMFALAMVAISKIAAIVGHTVGVILESVEVAYWRGRHDVNYDRHREFVSKHLPTIKANLGIGKTEPKT